MRKGGGEYSLGLRPTSTSAGRRATRGVRMIRLLSLGAFMALCGPTTACNPCLNQGRNGVAEPDPNEFQLVFSNIVSRATELLVDNLDDEWDAVSSQLCEETEYITVGNFSASTQTTIEIRSGISDGVCHVSPCCTSSCDSQQCDGAPVVDTTPFAGGVFVTGLVWKF
jgi:hypothetical protein